MLEPPFPHFHGQGGVFGVPSPLAHEGGGRVSERLWSDDSCQFTIPMDAFFLISICMILSDGVNEICVQGTGGPTSGVGCWRRTARAGEDEERPGPGTPHPLLFLFLNKDRFATPTLPCCKYVGWLIRFMEMEKTKMLLYVRVKSVIHAKGRLVDVLVCSCAMPGFQPIQDAAGGPRGPALATPGRRPGGHPC